MSEIRELMDEIIQFSEECDWDQFHSPVNLAKSISIEAGELLECYQWNDNADPDAVEEELADILNYSLQLAAKLNLDPAEIVRKKMKISCRIDALSAWHKCRNESDIQNLKYKICFKIFCRYKCILIW